MAYNILNLKQDLTGIIHGTTLNKVQNLDGLINRSARQLLLDIDPLETQRIAQFATPIFQGTQTYPLNADVKGNKIIDIRPQINRFPGESFNQDYSKQFNQNILNSLVDQFNIQWNTGVRVILVNAPLFNSGVVVNGASGTTLNGTWTAGGNASNLTTNPLNFVFGSGSLQFDLAAGAPGSTGYLENSTMSPVDLQTFLNFATWFLWTFLPQASVFSSVELRFGSSSGNYYHVSTTVTQALTAFQNGWNLLAYLWSNAAVVGSPNPAAIDYLRVTWTYDGTAQTGVLLNDITSRLGQIMEYVYYSQYLFRSIGGVFQETVLDDSDLINLNVDSYNLLLNQLAYLTAQQLQGIDASFFDANFFLQNYKEGIIKYQALYKSEVQKPTNTYYSLPNNQYGQFVPRRWA